MSDGGASPATGLRVVDVFTLRDRATLVRNTSVYKDGVRVGAAQGAYELLETDDERSAMDLCAARRAEFQASVRVQKRHAISSLHLPSLRRPVCVVAAVGWHVGTQ